MWGKRKKANTRACVWVGGISTTCFLLKEEGCHEIKEKNITDQTTSILSVFPFFSVFLGRLFVFLATHWLKRAWALRQK